jgi:hypothetical protein
MRVFASHSHYRSGHIMHTTVTSTAPQFSRAGIVWLLALVLFGRMDVAPVLALAEVVGALGIAAFVANLFVNLKD